MLIAVPGTCTGTRTSTRRGRGGTQSTATVPGENQCQKLTSQTVDEYELFEHRKEDKKLVTKRISKISPNSFKSFELSSSTKEVSVTLSENGNPKEISAKLIEKCKSLTKYSNTWYYNKCDELNSK